MKRFEIIEFLKGYSIFTIMMFHYVFFLDPSSPLDKLIYFGGTGIHLFIFLSGFGLYFSSLKKPLTYPMFLKRRLTKIYTPYIFTVLLSALISLFLPVFQNSLYALGGHLFLYKMFDESIIASYGYPLWFISMIIQFYFAFFIIKWLITKIKSKRLFLLLMLLVSLGWSAFVLLIGKDAERVYNSFFLQYLWEFSLGMVVAYKIKEDGKLPWANTNMITLFIVSIVNIGLYSLLALKAREGGQLFNDIFAFTGYTLLAVFIYKLKLTPINKFFTYVGNISFSVYLLHILLLLTLSEIFTTLDPLIIVAASFVLIFPAATIYQRLVNRFFEYQNL